MVTYLDEAAVRAALRWDELITAMEDALAAFSSGRVLQPVRNVLTIEEGKRYLGVMPAVAEHDAVQFDRADVNIGGRIGDAHWGLLFWEAQTTLSYGC